MIPVARPAIGPDELAAVARVLQSGVLSQGPEVEGFEAEFAAAVGGGTKMIAVNSGTSALHLMLVACGVGVGDEVIVPSFSFAATANAVALTGATPVFVDIDARTFTLDPSAVEASIGPRTRAVLPVHLYGHPASMTRLAAICEASGILLLEDAAQAHLASWDGKHVGTFGEAAAFSFYPTKNMTAGEGGMVATRSERVERSVRLLRNQGQERRYENEVLGYNNRMSDVHAAIGRVQLLKLKDWTEVRRSNASFYIQNIVGPLLPVEAPEAFHVYHQFTIRVPATEREAIAQELLRRGVQTGVYYPTPIHQLPSFAQGAKRWDLEETERVSAEVLSLPVHPTLSVDELQFVASAVTDVCRAGH